ncbi:MAG: hypothetical protein OEY38_19415 [Gammaproteobacteria bacterium]|nr:hypothetical protein [Gammaproteobacteria bacterium]
MNEPTQPLNPESLAQSNFSLWLVSTLCASILAIIPFWLIASI